MAIHVTIAEMDESTMDKVLALKVSKEQTAYVPSSGGIIARAWVHRSEEARLYIIHADNEPAGLILVYEMTQAPACYFLMEMLVDQEKQGKGIGTAALSEIIKRYSIQPKFPMIELSVDKENRQARHVYEKAGFVDSGYIDPALPQYVNMVYRF